MSWDLVGLPKIPDRIQPRDQWSLSTTFSCTKQWSGPNISKSAGNVLCRDDLTNHPVGKQQITPVTIATVDRILPFAVLCIRDLIPLLFITILGHQRSGKGMHSYPLRLTTRGEGTGSYDDPKTWSRTELHKVSLGQV